MSQGAAFCEGKHNAFVESPHNARGCRAGTIDPPFGTRIWVIGRREPTGANNIFGLDPVTWLPVVAGIVPWFSVFAAIPSNPQLRNQEPAQVAGDLDFVYVTVTQNYQQGSNSFNMLVVLQLDASSLAVLSAHWIASIVAGGSDDHVIGARGLQVTTQTRVAIDAVPDGEQVRSGTWEIPAGSIRINYRRFDGAIMSIRTGALSRLGGDDAVVYAGANPFRVVSKFSIPDSLDQADAIGSGVNLPPVLIGGPLSYDGTDLFAMSAVGGSLGAFYAGANTRGEVYQIDDSMASVTFRVGPAPVTRLADVGGI